MSPPLPLLVGEANPYGADPRYALYCDPPQSAGARLQRLIMALKKKTYLSSFERVNLCPVQWSTATARARAADLRGQAAAERVIVLFGRKVAEAFGKRTTATSWAWYPDEHLLCLPHPSGLCRAWDDEGACERARELLRRAIPHVPFGELPCGRTVVSGGPGFSSTCLQSAGHYGKCSSGSEVCINCGHDLRPMDRRHDTCPYCGST